MIGGLLRAMPDISMATIGIVAGCCAGLILVLLIVLLVFCCRRHREYKEVDNGVGFDQSDCPRFAISHEQQQRLLLEQQQQHHHHHQQQSVYQPVYQRVYQSADGRPYALVPPHSSLSADSIAGIAAGSKRNSLVVKQRREVGNDADEIVESAGHGVFATLRSGRNPVDSSSSNPALFNYSQEFLDVKRSVDSVGPDHVRQCKKVVYEVVV